MIKQFCRFSAPLILWLVLCSPVVAGLQPTVVDQIQLQSIVSSSSANFGLGVDSVPGLVIVGAPREGTATGDQAGIVTVYEEMVVPMGPSSWLNWTTVTPPDARIGANFGNAVAISGNWLMVGAEFDAVFPDFARGKAYTFYIDRMMQTVSYVATLDPLLPSNFDQWGSKLALGTDFAYMGSENADRSQSDEGQVEVFARTGIGLSATWLYQETLLGADVVDHSFGSSIATTMDGRRVIVGADGGGTGGALYLFDYNVGGYFDFTCSYSLPMELAEDGNNFGTSIALSYDGLTAVVGADAEGVGAGKAWVISLPDVGASFVLPPAPPVPVLLVDPEGEVGEQFGSSVAIMGDLIAVGAEENNDAGVNSGAIFLFGRDVGGPGTWGLIEQVNAFNASMSDRFGTALSLQDDHLVVGAPLWRNPATAQSEGAAYVLSLPEPGATGLALSASLTLLWLRSRRAIGVRR